MKKDCMEYFENIGENLTFKNRVYENIKLQIILGNLKNGSRLKEAELSKVMNISRAPIREAFSQLEKEGFITIIPRKGAFVSVITTQDVEDIFELRLELESLAITKSLSKIDMSEIEEAGNNFKKFIDKPATEKNRIQYLEYDKSFHALLSKHCGNKRLIELLEKLQEQIHWFRNISLRRLSLNDSIEGHLAIIAAIKKNNNQIVIKRLNQHLQRAKELILMDITMPD